MENSTKVLFEDDTKPQWYIALGDRWVGPLSAADVYERILSNEITWAHFVWKAGQNDWKRVCDVKTFQAAVPTLPPRGVQSEVKQAAAPTVKAAPGGKRGAPPPAPAKPAAEPEAPSTERLWFLHYNDTQYGPFSEEEIGRFLRVGKIHGRVHAWREGMPTWERLEKLAAYDAAVEESKKAREKKTPASAAVTKKEKTKSTAVRENRTAPRRPMVARILLSNDETVISAVCRDISVGGMQVLTDRVPGITGTKLKMNISPAGGIAPFVAEGVIVRILEDGRGFSFRFDRLPDNAKRAIESYISTQG